MYQSLFAIKLSPLTPPVPSFSLLWLQRPAWTTTTHEHKAISPGPGLRNTGPGRSLRRKPRSLFLGFKSLWWAAFPQVTFLTLLWHWETGSPSWSQTHADWLAPLTPGLPLHTLHVNDLFLTLGSSILWLGCPILPTSPHLLTLQHLPRGHADPASHPLIFRAPLPARHPHLVSLRSEFSRREIDKWEG